jgi:hypothetical protein
MKEVRIDCRAMFRLHALDLWDSAQPPRGAHWMLRRDYALRSWLADLARQYARVRRAGGDPFDGQPITGLAVIRALGLESCAEPESLWGHVKFTARMVVVTTSESFRLQRELMWLETHSRSAP